MTKPISNIEKARQRLFKAINDYPKVNLVSPSELLFELNKKIGSPITLKKLQNYSENIDVPTNASEAESISSLLEVSNGFEGKSLEEIIELIA